MNKAGKAAIVIALAVAVVAVIALKKHDKETKNEPPPATGGSVVLPFGAQGNRPGDASLEDRRFPGETDDGQRLPRLVDLGAKKCIPCKMMAPILEELKKEYEGRLIVQFIDVWEKPQEAKRFEVRMIPTQIFYDASGKEIFRHTGFFAKEDILKTWKEKGFDFKEKGS